jgi:hypothetical protein
MRGLDAPLWQARYEKSVREYRISVAGLRGQITP